MHPYIHQHLTAARVADMHSHAERQRIARAARRARRAARQPAAQPGARRGSVFTPRWA
jgi:hypothetical protein